MKSLLRGNDRVVNTTFSFDNMGLCLGENANTKPNTKPNTINSNSNSNTEGTSSKIKNNLVKLYSRITNNQRLGNESLLQQKKEPLSKLNDCKLELLIYKGEDNNNGFKCRSSVSNKHVFKNISKENDTNFEEGNINCNSNCNLDYKKDKIESLKSGIFKLLEKEKMSSSPLRKKLTERKMSANGRSFVSVNSENPEKRLKDLLNKQVELKRDTNESENTLRLNNMKKIVVNTLYRGINENKNKNRFTATTGNNEVYHNVVNTSYVQNNTYMAKNPLLDGLVKSSKGKSNKTHSEEADDFYDFNSGNSTKKYKADNSLTMRLNFLNNQGKEKINVPLQNNLFTISSPRQELNFNYFDSPLQASPSHRKLRSISSL